jgi:hypothetical protein
MLQYRISQSSWHTHQPSTDTHLNTLVLYNSSALFHGNILVYLVVCYTGGLDLWTQQALGILWERYKIEYEMEMKWGEVKWKIGSSVSKEVEKWME